MWSKSINKRLHNQHRKTLRATSHMNLWELKRKCPKVVPRLIQNHEKWSWTLKCSVKSYERRHNALYCITGHRDQYRANGLAFMPVFNTGVIFSFLKSYVTGPSTNCYFKEFLFMRALTHDKGRINQRFFSVRGDTISRFCVRPTSKRCFLKNNPSDHETGPFDAI
jgi:hypothetical protein